METNVERRRKRSASAERIKNAYNGANHVEVEVIEAADAALPDNTPKEMRVCAYLFVLFTHILRGNRSAIRADVSTDILSVHNGRFRKFKVMPRISRKALSAAS